ncbi:hypothetical protein FOMG_09182 [Fusarium oxysporum f. sp. melonis 26406]|uniref:Uncharacterized protein n=1 Tax=Fusarium oxysporum f. sp. melonis 26406 TaxID=1089452 RepID=W9ZXA0_FUSOX|nr:hypothetical protein FOMG_09182 [Fusarium oxysporum f. sp. melonis 26406]
MSIHSICASIRYRWKRDLEPWGKVVVELSFKPVNGVEERQRLSIVGIETAFDANTTGTVIGIILER